jgi:hypothetical protein
MSGLLEPDSKVEDALHDSGCDDGILFFRGGIAYLEFDREAEELQGAILSAVKDVEKAKIGVRVARVEPGDFVNASEIARRLDCSREYVRLLTQGKRGKGKFPSPCSGVTSKTLVWSWAEVVRWLLEHQRVTDDTILQTAETIRDINDALELRQNPRAFERRLDLLQKLGKLVEHSEVDGVRNSL